MSSKDQKPMKNDMNSKVEEVMRSIDGIRRAQSPDNLFGKILTQLESEGSKPRLVSTRVAWSVAAVLAILFILNISVARNYMKRSYAPAATGALLKDYGIATDDMDIYKTTP